MMHFLAEYADGFYAAVSDISDFLRLVLPFALLLGSIVSFFLCCGIALGNLRKDGEK